MEKCNLLCAPYKFLYMSDCCINRCHYSLNTKCYVTTVYRKVQLPGFCTQRLSTRTKRKQEKNIAEGSIKLDVNNKINNPYPRRKIENLHDDLYMRVRHKVQADAARICAASKVDDIAYTGVLCVSSSIHSSLLRIALNHKAAVPNFLAFIARFTRVKFAKRFALLMCIAPN